MFSFDLESLKMNFSNPMLWAGLVLMVVAIIGYFWMNSRSEVSVPQQPSSVSFAPTTQLMEMGTTNQQEQQYHEPLEDQPTVATCMLNDAGEQVCA